VLRRSCFLSLNEGDAVIHPSDPVFKYVVFSVKDDDLVFFLLKLLKSLLQLPV